MSSDAMPILIVLIICLTILASCGNPSPIEVMVSRMAVTAPAVRMAPGTTLDCEVKR